MSKTFSLILRDASHTETIDGVTSFVGEDRTGSFGLMAGHSRFMTALVMGLARYRIADQPWQYMAQSGSVLYFEHDTLSISTRHYYRGEDYTLISDALQQQLLAEEEKLDSIKHSLKDMEQEVLRHMWDMRRSHGMKT